MPHTILMETDSAQAAVDALRNQAEHLNDLVQELNSSARRLAGAWQGNRAVNYYEQLRFVSRRLEERAVRLEMLTGRLQNEIYEWEAADRKSNDPLFVFYKNIAGALSGGGAALAAGEVLGAATSVFSGMRWSDRFALATDLQKKIEEYRSLYGLSGTEQEIASQYADIERQIQELEVKRATAQGEADRWYNKIIPDFPLAGDSEDGVPWRVKADDYEDEVKQYDEELSRLRGEKDRLSEFMDLQSQKQALDANLQSGIAFDGPSSKHKYFEEPQCTWYASGKRNVPCSGNANVWDDQAKTAGYEVGDRPVKGAVMVFEGGVRGSSEKYGHVAIVENVTQNADGSYKVHISESNWAGKAYNERDLNISGGQNGAGSASDGISFIYDKK